MPTQRDSRPYVLVGVVLLLLAAVLFGLAYDEYSTNAEAVRAMNDSPLGGLARGVFGNEPLEPSVPKETKVYSLFGGVALVGGIVSFFLARKR